MCWPELTLYPKQREVLISLRDNVQTFVHAGNELGKDFISGIAAVWYFTSRTPCRVITSSSGETQLKSVLWGEIRHRLSTSRYKFPFTVSTLEIKKLTPTGIDERSYLLGHVTKTVENFQGHHLPHDRDRVLALFDEASGIADEFFTASESWFHRCLVIGNPLSTTNFFYRACKEGDLTDPANPKSPHLLRKIIHISCDDSPNVQLGKKLAAAGYDGSKGWPTIIPGVISYPEYLRRLKTWDKIKATMRLFGNFYEGAESLLFPPDWLDIAETRYKQLHPLGYFARPSNRQGRKAVAMGIDGGAGRDLTVWTIIDQHGVIHQDARQTPDTMQIVGQTLAYIKEFDISPRMVGIDVGGGGKQISDRLKELKCNIRTIAFGGAATAPKEQPAKKMSAKVDEFDTRQTYKNRRVEMYGILRNLLDPQYNPSGFAIPEELHDLRRELSVHPLWYDSDGKMILPPKDRSMAKQNDHSEEVTIKKLLGHSPDRADSLVLATFVMQEPIVRRVIGAK